MARNKHPEQTVQLILETAARLFAQKGYDETSMQDIMDATHLSKGAIYHHFKGKEETGNKGRIPSQKKPSFKENPSSTLNHIG